MRNLLAAAAFCATFTSGLIVAPPIASATTAFEPFDSNYDILSGYDVSDIAILETYPDSGSVTNSFSVSANTDQDIVNPFTETAPVTGAFLIGVATNLASDGGDGQQHLVLFGNDSFVDSAEGVAFGTLFPNTTEGSLINALEVIGQTTPGDVGAAYGVLFNFQSGDAANSPNGSVSFQIGDPFEEVAFSGGQIIGGGTSFATPAPAVAAAPEPASWALMLLGVAGLGAALRAHGRTDRRLRGMRAAA